MPLRPPGGGATILVRDSAAGGIGEAAPGAADRCAPVADTRIEGRAVTLRTEREADSPGRQAAVYGVFVLLVIAYTWPLVANPGAHLRQVKGAAPGTAVEAFGPARLTRVVGRDRGDLLVARHFRLE